MRLLRGLVSGFVGGLVSGLTRGLVRESGSALASCFASRTTATVTATRVGSQVVQVSLLSIHISVYICLCVDQVSREARHTSQLDALAIPLASATAWFR
jgi:hypothetical protein